jgi:MFS-type transporter involved in bile tolerance (Atg22 family)
MDSISVFLFHAHSGLRYLVLLAGVASFLYSLVAALTNRPWDRGGRVLLTSFIGLLDVQVLIGLILVFVWPFHAALWGHIVLMILAAGAAHVTSVVNKRRPPGRRDHLPVALGVAGAVVLIVAGITAIGRPIL